MDNPYAVQRPHATQSLLQRQGSFRGFEKLHETSSPFKRSVSLRLSDLPSTLKRQNAVLESPPNVGGKCFSVTQFGLTLKKIKKSDCISCKRDWLKSKQVKNGDKTFWLKFFLYLKKVGCQDFIEMKYINNKIQL